MQMLKLTEHRVSDKYILKPWHRLQQSCIENEYPQYGFTLLYINSVFFYFLTCYFYKNKTCSFTFDSADSNLTQK